MTPSAHLSSIWAIYFTDQDIEYYFLLKKHTANTRTWPLIFSLLNENIFFKAYFILFI